ncbi:CDC42 small effector protein 1 isoform X1 [Rhinolophus sinicus]|uniref:CDC42 small effector protein 1 isoform X1 n=1 Tax=Rhinolophus sinicus TaxID=89399 RepID=UPI003D7A704C
MLLRISELGWGDLGAPLRFASRAKGTCDSGGPSLDARPPPGVRMPRFAQQGCGPRGLPRRPPTALRLQRLFSPGGSCAPGSQPDGFRNRVAAVSALRQPHLCRPALGSPTAPRSEPGNPTLAGTKREPPTSCSRAPRCGSRAGFHV